MFKKGHISCHKGKHLIHSGSFKKGQVAWNKNTKGVMKPNSGSFQKGKPNFNNRGRKRPDLIKRNKENPLKMDNNPNWQGGISFEPYGIEFNEDLKEVIRNRDRRKCQMCKKTELENQEKLSIHHIDYNKQNNNPNNLITLCRKCHLKTNHNRDYWINYFICHK